MSKLLQRDDVSLNRHSMQNDKNERVDHAKTQRSHTRTHAHAQNPRTHRLSGRACQRTNTTLLGILKTDWMTNMSVSAVPM